VVKIGRTHLQDAVPLTFARSSADGRAELYPISIRLSSAQGLYDLAIGERQWHRTEHAIQNLPISPRRRSPNLLVSSFPPRNNFAALPSTSAHD